MYKFISKNMRINSYKFIKTNKLMMHNLLFIITLRLFVTRTKEVKPCPLYRVLKWCYESVKIFKIGGKACEKLTCRHKKGLDKAE